MEFRGKLERVIYLSRDSNERIAYIIFRKRHTNLFLEYILIQLNETINRGIFFYATNHVIDNQSCIFTCVESMRKILFLKILLKYYLFKFIVFIIIVLLLLYLNLLLFMILLLIKN